MIQHPAFEIEPWAIRETELRLDLLPQTESIFALANGHVGLRANLDEAEPFGLPGTYLNGFYESWPLPYAERGYGFPESGQAVVNVTNGKVIRLLVDDEPFDVRYGRLISHERTLDFRAGVLRRVCEWESPSGQKVRITSVRLVSLVQRAVAAISYEVEPIDQPTRLVVQSELVANEPVPTVQADPRAAAAVGQSLNSEDHLERDLRATLVHSTRASELLMAASMDHIVDGPAGTETHKAESAPDVGRVLVTTDAEPGERLRVVKLVAYGWSGTRSVPAVRAQVGAALAEARHTGWEGLCRSQARYLDDFWTRADVELEGDARLQAAVRFGLFHTLQAGARAERRAIPAKGLTGPGYDGHAFWDTEMFVLPVLTYSASAASSDALRWRHSTLDLARERARVLGLEGAAFPWRTIHGEECSGYWPAGTAAFHVNAAIANAVVRHQAATADDSFERDIGLELLVETARLWRSLGHHDSSGRFRIDGVTGPDEYSAIADNNVYTNLMAQRNLRAAADAVARNQDRCTDLGIDLEEAAAWRDAAETIWVPYDAHLGVHPQADDFTSHQKFDLSSVSEDQYPLFLNFPYFDLYRKQVVKQADLVLALHQRGDAFTADQKARNFAYYEPLTVRDSSLSACTQAIIAAEVGHLELAYAYFGEAALMDLYDHEHNTRDGVHIASLAGAWSTAVAGFGGMRDHDGQLSFAPRLPQSITRLAFGLFFAGRQLRVEVNHREARYSLLQGEPLEIEHHGRRVTVTGDRAVRRSIPGVGTIGPSPPQPPGREPAQPPLP